MQFHQEESLNKLDNNGRNLHQSNWKDHRMIIIGYYDDVAVEEVAEEEEVSEEREDTLRSR